MIWLAALATCLTWTLVENFYEGVWQGQEEIYQSIYPCLSMALIDLLMVSRCIMPSHKIIWMGSHRDFSFLGKKADLSKSALCQTVYFGLSTINHSVIKKNGKRDALAFQDWGILIKLNRGLRKEAQKRKRSTHSRKYLKIPDQTRIKGKCKEFSEKRKDFNLMVTGSEVKLE